jgi:hypothetical protein
VKLAQNFPNGNRKLPLILAWCPMDDSTRRTRGVQRGPRSKQVVEKVREATVAELARAGFPRLTNRGSRQGGQRQSHDDLSAMAVQGRAAAGRPRTGAPALRPGSDTGSLDGELLAPMVIIGETSALSEWQAVQRAVGATSDELKELVDTVNDRSLGAFQSRLRTCTRPRRGGSSRRHRNDRAPGVLRRLLWREGRQCPPREEECRRILRVVLARLTGTTSAPPAGKGR